MQYYWFKNLEFMSFFLLSASITCNNHYYHKIYLVFYLWAFKRFSSKMKMMDSYFLMFLFMHYNSEHGRNNRKMFLYYDCIKTKD